MERENKSITLDTAWKYRAQFNEFFDRLWKKSKKKYRPHPHHIDIEGMVKAGRLRF